MNGLYKRGFIKEAYEVFSTIYRLANDTEKAKIYPGIPEYISNEGQGKYHYLSGSASWLLMTVLTQMYGVRGEYGDLVLQPKLVKEQFDSKGEAKTCAFFLGKRIVVNYKNSNGLDYENYGIAAVKVNDVPVEFNLVEKKKIRIDKDLLNKILKDKATNLIEVILA